MTEEHDKTEDGLEFYAHPQVPGGWTASGREWAYLVFGDMLTGIRLTRYRPMPGQSASEAAFAGARWVIDVGKPPVRRGDPAADLNRLRLRAMNWAQVYEGGGSLAGKPGWQNFTPPAGPGDIVRITVPVQAAGPGEVLRTGTGRVITEEEIAQWAEEAERGYDLDELPPIPGHAGPGHTPDGPQDCARCQLLRDNAHWMEHGLEPHSHSHDGEQGDGPWGPEPHDHLHTHAGKPAHRHEHRHAKESHG